MIFPSSFHTTLFSVSIIFLLLLISCDISSDEGYTAGINPSIAIVYGEVTSEANVPISEVNVFFNIFNAEDCNTKVPDSKLGNAGSELTDENGEFRIRGKYLHISRQTFCVEFKIKPPAESKFDSTIVRGHTVEFINESLTPPVDSVEINATLTQK